MELKLSRPSSTYGTPPDWEDEYLPVDFVCVSANTFLCPTCEQAMRDERLEAELAYQFIYDDGNDDDLDNPVDGVDDQLDDISNSIADDIDSETTDG